MGAGGAAVACWVVASWRGQAMPARAQQRLCLAGFHLYCQLAASISHSLADGQKHHITANRASSKDRAVQMRHVKSRLRRTLLNSPP